MASAFGVADDIDMYVQSLDCAVAEVFDLMMGMRCCPVDECPAEERQMISAVIGLAGAMSGICMLSSGEKVALHMAGILTGSSIATLNDTVKDAMGEVCNMIAGVWKAKQPSLAYGCMLSTPTVVTGTNYRLHNQRPKFRIERFYCFEGSSFAVTLLCESME